MLQSRRWVYRCDFVHYFCKLIRLLLGHRDELHSHSNQRGNGNRPCTYVQQYVRDRKPKSRLNADGQWVVCFDVTTATAYIAQCAPSPALPASEYLGRTRAREAGGTTAL